MTTIMMTRSQSQSPNSSGRTSPKNDGHDDQSGFSQILLAQKLALLVQQTGGAANMVGDEASPSSSAAAAPPRFAAGKAGASASVKAKEEKVAAPHRR